MMPESYRSKLAYLMIKAEPKQPLGLKRNVANVVSPASAI
jgi:hypothetical protein